MLYGQDVLTGALSTNCTSTAIAKNFNITQGSLTAGTNYNLTFVGGTLSVIDKTPQNIVVSEIPSTKTYGDAGFKITVTPDTTSNLDNFTITSSDADVATVDAQGNVVIKGVGTTTVTVREAGNSEYAPFEKTYTLTVNKAQVTITANDVVKKIGQDDPALTYVKEGELFDSDEITGALTRVAGEEVGTYDILIGTLAINDNYEIIFNKGVFEILDKTPQTITVADIGAKIYGAGTFELQVTPDAESGLDIFTYTSSNTDVAEIAADGTVTIKAAGKTEITVAQAGNDEYAATEKKVTLVVDPIEITVTAIDLDNKTAEFEGVLVADATGVELDFDKIKTTVLSSEKTTVEETTTVTTNVKITNLKLKGEKSKNYIVSSEDYLNTTVTSTTVSENLTDNENVTIEAALVDDKTIIVTEVTVSPESDIKDIVIDVTNIASTEVNTIAIPKETVDSIIGIDTDVTLEIVVKNGSAENGTVSIVFNAQAIASISAAGASAATVSISVYKTEAEELEPAQAETLATVSEKTPVVYSLSVVDEAGNSLASDFGGSGSATVRLPYVRPAINGNVIVKYLDDFGNATLVPNSIYDSANHFVKVIFGHFSEYLIYTEPVVYSGGGGSSSLFVKFETNGGNTIKSISVKRNTVINEPTAPTKDGYTFDGWYTDKDLTTEYDFSAKVTKSFTLYAKWVENEEITPEKWNNPFIDVDADDWYYETVKTAYEKGLMNGISNTEFGADTNVTRGMFVTVLYRMENEPAAPKLNFTDVESGAYYADAIAWANVNNIVTGNTNTEFAPNDNITREQMATILFRYATYKGVETVNLSENLNQFTDNGEISEYAVFALDWVVGTNIMSGKGNGILDPKGLATRAEAATVLVRMVK